MNRNNKFLTLNVYHHNGRWCFAAFLNGEFDTSDVIDVPPEATKERAVAAARELYKTLFSVRPA